jgi:hypothetical protein
MTKFEKSHIIHEYLVQNIKYENNFEQNENAFNVYGALIDGLAVCQGYAQAYKLLLHMAGIESKIVTGIARDENHAWNLVNYDGVWYHVDVTWNDPDEFDSNRYFNVNDYVMADSHTWNREFFPAANSINLNYFEHNGLTANSADELQNVFGAIFDGERDVYEILCKFGITDEDLFFLNMVAGIDTSNVSYMFPEYGDYVLLTLLL